MKKVIIRNETIIIVITYEPTKQKSNWKSISLQCYCLNDKPDKSFINVRWTTFGFYNNTEIGPIHKEVTREMWREIQNTLT